MATSDRIKLRPMRLAVPTLLMVLGVVLTFLLWKALVAQEEAHLHRELTNDVQVMKTILDLDLQERGFDPQVLFQPASFLSPSISVVVRRGGEVLFSRGTVDPKTIAWKETATLEMYGSIWEIEVQPSSNFFKGHRSWLSKAVLGGGLLVSFLMGLALTLAQDARRRARALVKAQRQLRSAHSVLEANVQSRTQELRKALDALSQENIERTRSEQALHESVARFRAMSDASPLGIFVTDTQGKCVYSNPRLQLLLGIPAEEIEGHSWDFFLHEEERSAVEIAWSEAIRHYRTYEHVHRFVRSDQQQVWAMVKAAPIHDGLNFSGHVGVVEDITARRAGEKQLEESERRYRALADSIPQMVWTATSDGFLDYYNRRWCDYTGMSSEQTQIEGWKAVLHPEDFEMCAEQWYQSLQTGKLFQIEYRLKRVSDGIYRWYLGQALPWRDSSGKIMKWFGTCTDIEDQKRLQIELVDAKQAAESAAQAKTNFLANISHEIRTPINGIIGTTGLLAETALDSEQKEFAEILQTSSEALLTIINDLLDLSKMDAGKLVLEREDVDVQRTVESAIVLFSERLHLKKLEFSLFVSPDVPAMIKGDAVRIRQVLINLLGNAIKYTETGGITLSITVITPKPATQRGLRFEITDTGIGMSEEQQVSLFQPFYQADSSASRSYGGTGLGLAISKQLVTVMNGTIGLKSVFGQGSKFWFEVPFGEVVEQPIPSSLKGKRILVSEGDENGRAALVQQLSLWKADVHAVAEGKGALDALRHARAHQQPFDIVLTAWQLPDMEGIKLAQSVADDEQCLGVRVVMMAGLARHSRRRELEAARIAAFVNKPILYSHLFTALSETEAPAASGVFKADVSAPESRCRYDTGEPIRILLAEDNPVNQTVAVRQLERMGYTCDAVSNGREALEATLVVQYDLVLMDLQMPEMDGYETTDEIRRRESSGRRLTIVAMTAHALKEDRDRCLTAGMDDYIRKPVKPAALAAVIEKWVPSQSQGQSLEARSMPTPETAETRVQHIDEEQFAATLSAEGADHGALLKLYLESTIKNLRELSSALENTNWARVESVAHSAAGANAMVGMNELARILRDLERDAKDGDHACAAQWLGQAHGEFQRIELFLKEKITDSNSAVA